MSAFPPVLDPELAAFVTGPVSIVLASRDADNLAHLVRAVGCRVAPDRRRVHILVDAGQSEALLADLRANHRVAVVFSRPSSHRTLQLKSTRAAVEPPQAGDVELMRSYRERMVGELELLGHGRGFTLGLLASRPEQLVVVSLAPEEAYVQTPGPRAGAPLRGGAEGP